MKILELHRELGLTNEEKAFNYLIDTISTTVRGWDYFVNWDKVFTNGRSQTYALELLQPIVGSKDVLSELRELLRVKPEAISAIPNLLVRDGSSSSSFNMLSRSASGRLASLFVDFDREGYLTEQEIEDVVEFVDKTGLKKIFEVGGVASLHDYLLGVEAGIDSNGRKNRGGSAMETLVEASVKSLVDKNPGWKYLEQASDKTIEASFGREFAVHVPGRRFDFAIFTGEKVVLMEVNFYSAGGSKLKATAGEFIGLSEQFSSSHAELVWITDGQGWKTAKGPLRSAYERIDNIFNLNLLELGALDEVCKS